MIAPCDDEPRLRVGVLGAGAWATFAHLPGFRATPRCELVAIADPQVELARAAAKFGFPPWRPIIAR